MSAETRRRNVLIGFGAVAVVIVAVLSLYPPDWPREDASGAIGAVEKHRETQITESDVILVDEATRQEEAVAYGDYLDDAAKLQNISVELNAALRDSDEALQARANAARGSLLKHEEMLQARYAAKFASTLDAISRAVAANELVLDASRKAQLQNDLDQLSARLKGRALLQAEDMEALGARLRNIDELLSARAQQRLKDTVQLESDFAALESRGRLKDSDFQSLEARLKAVSSDLNQARQNFVANQDYLQSLVLESRSVRAALAGFADLNQARLQAISADLASEAAMLESRATRNLQARLKNDAEMGARMRNIENALGSARRAFAANETMLDARLKSSFNASLKNAEELLGSRRAQHQARLAGRIQNELSAIDRHMKNREELGARLKNVEELASGKRQALQARSVAASMRDKEQLAARETSVLASAAAFESYLSNLDQALNGNAFESLAQRQQFALEARAINTRLQARAR